MCELIPSFHFQLLKNIDNLTCMTPYSEPFLDHLGVVKIRLLAHVSVAGPYISYSVELNELLVWLVGPPGFSLSWSWNDKFSPWHGSLEFMKYSLRFSRLRIYRVLYLYVDGKGRRFPTFRKFWKRKKGLIFVCLLLLLIYDTRLHIRFTRICILEQQTNPFIFFYLLY